MCWRFVLIANIYCSGEIVNFNFKAALSLWTSACVLAWNSTLFPSNFKTNNNVTAAALPAAHTPTRHFESDRERESGWEFWRRPDLVTLLSAWASRRCIFNSSLPRPSSRISVRKLRRAVEFTSYCLYNAAKLIAHRLYIHSTTRAGIATENRNLPCMPNARVCVCVCEVQQG